MRFYFCEFDTNHLILFLMYFKTFGQCLLITPRTIPDDIGIFNSSHDHRKGHVLGRVNSDKPWIAYVESNLKKSLSECFSRMLKSTKFSEMWQCTFNFSTTYQIMNHKMKMSCAESDKSGISEIPRFSIRENEVADIKPDKLIIGRFIISTTKCPSLLYLWLTNKIPKNDYYHNL